MTREDISASEVSSVLLAGHSHRIHPSGIIKLLYFAAVIVSSVTIDLMVLKFGGHASTFYTGFILLGICVLGIVPARFSMHSAAACIIYAIYLVPILVIDPPLLHDDISHFRGFITANAFLIITFSVLLLLRYFAQRSLAKASDMPFCNQSIDRPISETELLEAYTHGLREQNLL